MRTVPLTCVTERALNLTLLFLSSSSQLGSCSKRLAQCHKKRTNFIMASQDIMIQIMNLNTTVNMQSEVDRSAYRFSYLVVVTISNY